MFKNKTITFVLDDPYYYYKGCYYSSNPLVRFFGELNICFKSVCLSVPVLKNKEVNNKYFLCPSDVNILKRPFYKNKINFFKKTPFLLLPTFIQLYKAIKQSNIVIVRLPCVVSPLISMLNYFHSKKLICYVAGDIFGRRKKIKRFGVMDKLFNFFLSIYRNFENFLVKNYPAIFLGKALIKNYDKINSKYMFFSMNLIKENEIFYRNDTCQNDLIKLLYVGNIEKEKGLDALLEALNYLQAKEINFILEIVGEGPYRSFLEKKIKKLDLQDKVKFSGAIMFGNELFQKYKSADIFVLPSLSEGIPKVLFEAMAFGLPIVATKVGGIPDVIKHLENGYLVKPGNSIQLAEAINVLIKNSDLRKKIIQNNYVLVKTCTLEKQVEKFCDFVAQVCAEY